MNCTDCTAKLPDYVDGDLAAAGVRAVEAHLAHCPACRAEFESLCALLRQAAALPKAVAPVRDLWPGIERAVRADLGASVSINAPQSDLPVPPAKASASRSSRLLRFFVPLAVAAAIAFLATFAPRPITSSSDTAGWEVASLAGAPRIGSKALRGEGRIRVGQWLETDAASRARMSVGEIGEVSVEPNSRLRVLEAAKTDHRLQLARGTMHAFIIAPPRIFVVDTPSATAVDLGCAYTLTVDEEGNGKLHVTTGSVALEHPDRESYIPGGAMCVTRRNIGPGTPFVTDAPEALRDALQHLDFERDRSDATLHVVLNHARNDDAVTLWHLLARTDGAQRTAVYERLAGFRPPPDGVTREGILAGDAAMRRKWGRDLGYIW